MSEANSASFVWHLWKSPETAQGMGGNFSHGHIPNSEQNDGSTDSHELWPKWSQRQLRWKLKSQGPWSGVQGYSQTTIACEHKCSLTLALDPPNTLMVILGITQSLIQVCAHLWKESKDPVCGP